MFEQSSHRRKLSDPTFIHFEALEDLPSLPLEDEFTKVKSMISEFYQISSANLPLVKGSEGNTPPHLRRIPHVFHLPPTLRDLPNKLRELNHLEF